MATPIFELCDSYVDRFVELDPLFAVYAGVPGFAGQATDLSPEGHEARAELARDTLRELAKLPQTSEDDRLAALFLRERLTAELGWYESGAPLRDVAWGFSTLREVRDAVEMLPRDTDEDWREIVAALRAVPATLASWRASVNHGLDTGIVAARRQALALSQQVEGYSEGTYAPLLTRYGDGALGEELRAAIQAAHSAYDEIARYLAEVYAPRASDTDAVGAELYRVYARRSLGAEPDPHDCYAWAWEELHRIEDAMARVAAEVAPDATIAEVAEQLDGSEYVEGVEAYHAWLVERHERALADLDGRHFDIDPAIRRIEVMIAPEAGGSAAYYTGPSEDLSRPGRTWWPTWNRTRFPTWREQTVAYHEGVPGHHLQIGQQRVAGDRLSRFAREFHTSAYSEGWALYAERLADELGWHTTPGQRLGCLMASALRATRVVIDIGVHLDLPLPPSEARRHGDRWTFEVASEVLRERGQAQPGQLTGEVMRYFGRPAQASSYKLGERAWLAAREEARGRLGADFDLKEWHTAALNLGPVGLDALADELRRAVR